MNCQSAQLASYRRIRILVYLEKTGDAVFLLQSFQKFVASGAISLGAVSHQIIYSMISRDESPREVCVAEGSTVTQIIFVWYIEKPQNYHEAKCIILTRRRILPG